jgi:phosphoglycolate phosphatase-like HAD superfamily hydrolase
VAELLDWLDVNQLRRALFSRNTHDAVKRIMKRLELRFDPVICREHAPFKPDPRGIWQICDNWGVRHDEVLMLGDYLYDIQAGKNAGVRTVLITHGKTWDFAQDADFVLTDFSELPALLQPHLYPEPR